MHNHISELSVREKAELVSGASFWTTLASERAGIESAVLTDGPHGVRRQRMEADHLGINDSEPATSFPTAAATGSSWDPKLLEELGAALGEESLEHGVDVLLGPAVNIKRSPLCGRNFEYFSEDPLLSGVLGAAWVRGLQSKGVGASLKHFAANNQETDRMRVSAEVDERSLREIYLPAFERVVKEAEPATVMCSYNRINGVTSSENHWLLSRVLRDEWGFKGYVMSDWGAVADPVAALAAGLDLEMPGNGDGSPDKIVAAVEAGLLDEGLLDRAVTRVATVHDRLRSRRTDASSSSPDHHELARRIAAASSVLLANDGGVLPLDPHVGGAISVIGAFATAPRYQGAGSSHIQPTHLDDALTAIRESTSRDVRYAPGFTLDASGNTELQNEAVLLAARSEVVVLFLGLPDAAESEGFDRKHLMLPQNQLDLFAEVSSANPNVVVVLSNGAVVSLEGVRGVAPAILEMWLAGQAAGSAAADVLFGVAEPGGRLAETIPIDLAHTPAFVNWPGTDGVVRYGEGTAVGYRWYDTTDREVAFPFGFGLGYTTFEYSDLKVTVPNATTPYAHVEVTVQNTGTRAGSDVAQIYVGENRPTVFRAPRELRAFEKVYLEPGESRRLRFELNERAFAYWGPRGWSVNPGGYTVAAGANSRDLPLRESVNLDVPPPLPVLKADSTVGEWFAHPVGQGIVADLFAPVGSSLSPDSDEFRMVESMPLRTMLGFVLVASGEQADSDSILVSLLEQAEQGTAG